MTPAAPADQEPHERLDLRLVPVAAALWAGAFAGLSLPWWVGLLGCAGCAVVGTAVGVRVRRATARRAVAMIVLCVVAGFALGAARAAPVRAGPVADLGAAGAYVEIEGVVVDDPELRGRTAAGGDGDVGGDGVSSVSVIGHIRVDRITGRGRTYRVRTPVLSVSRDTAWASLLPGQRVATAGLLEASIRPADDIAAVLRPRAGPDVLGAPGAVARATEPLREGLRRSVAGAGADARGLVPGLVVGDESLMTEDLRDDMRTTGLTHLTAVSGTNVTIMLVVVLGLARWSGIRGYALPALGVACVVGFVLLARPDPSVLRAAAMGTVAVVGLTVAGRRRGVPALAAAACALILIDPWLARSVGFVLSVLATAGILVLVPAWQRALWWLPRPLAVAVVVPLAAQVVCTPVLLAVAGELSLASLPANILVAPAVAPATVFGVAAAVVSPLVPPVAAVLGRLAAVPAGWIAAVARWFADQPGAVIGWPVGGAGVAAAVLLALAAVALLPLMLRRPAVSIAAVIMLALALFRVIPTPGWPPAGWIVVACDVGQGDAVVLRAGERTAVVVDAGREPQPVRRCLDSLGIDHVPLLVLSHFDSDHVGGVPGVLAGRDVGAALVSPVAEPADNAAAVGRWLEAAGVPSDVARVGDRHRVGESLSFEVVWPRRLVDAPGSSSNNASVVLDAEVGDIDVLLTGDVEPAAQRALMRRLPALHTDVLKVAHHGSPNQYPELLTGVGADVALIGVGDNTYGHPSPRVLEALAAASVRTFRTDHDGDVAVVRLPDDGLGVVRRGAKTSPRTRAGPGWRGDRGARSVNHPRDVVGGRYAGAAGVRSGRRNPIVKWKEARCVQRLPPSAW